MNDLLRSERGETRERFLIPLAFLAFVSLGLPDTLLGVAWPSMRATFGRPIGSLGLLAACGTLGYVASSFLAGTLTQRLGVGWLLADSCAIVTLSLALYAASPIWPLLLVGALFAGVGAGAIDGGINAFAAHTFSPRVLNWLHACWGVGATLGPIAMTAALESRFGWRLGYAIVGAALALMTLAFIVTRAAWQADRSDAARPSDRASRATIGEAIRHPAVIAHVAFYFVYGGIEFGVGNWLFTLLTNARGASIATAGGAVGLYFASLTIGRIAFGQLAHALGAATAIRLGLAGAIAGIALLFPGLPAVVGLASPAVLGFSLAPLFPTMIALTPRRVGRRFAAQSVAFQVSACSLGTAGGSAAIGMLANRFGIGVLPFVLATLGVALVVIHECLHRSTSARLERWKVGGDA